MVMQSCCLGEKVTIFDDINSIIQWLWLFNSVSDLFVFNVEHSNRGKSALVRQGMHMHFDIKFACTFFGRFL